MDEKLLAALAGGANAVPMPAAQAAAHASNVSEINRRVAEGAFDRVGVDRPPATFDTFRASYAAKGDHGVK